MHLAPVDNKAGTPRRAQEQRPRPDHLRIVQHLPRTRTRPHPVRPACRSACLHGDSGVARCQRGAPSPGREEPAEPPACPARPRLCPGLLVRRRLAERAAADEARARAHGEVKRVRPRLADGQAGGARQLLRRAPPAVSRPGRRAACWNWAARLHHRPRPRHKSSAVSGDGRNELLRSRSRWAGQPSRWTAPRRQVVKVRVWAPRRAHHGLGQRGQAAEQRGHHAAAPQRIPCQPHAARRRALARALPPPCAARRPVHVTLIDGCGFAPRPLACPHPTKACSMPARGRRACEPGSTAAPCASSAADSNGSVRACLHPN